MVAPTYSVKIGGTRNEEPKKFARDIWRFLLVKGITITAEYLPSVQNIQADWDSYCSKHSGESGNCVFKYYSKYPKY